MLRKSIVIIIIVVILCGCNNYKVIESTYSNEYYGYLIIPKINMQLGFYNIDNKNNNVNKNIEFIDTGIEDTYLLAGHSGNGNVSFFNDLRYLQESDIIYLWLGSQKITYEVVNIRKEKKNGKLKINNKSGYLILTTCDQITKGYQLIIECVKK